MQTKLLWIVELTLLYFFTCLDETFLGSSQTCRLSIGYDMVEPDMQ